MTAEMVAPAWMRAQVTAEQYDSWSEDQCAGIEVVDGMVVVSPSVSKRHNRLARILANAAVSCRIPMHLDGLTLSQAESGHLLLKDSGGKLVAEAPAPMMWDSSRNEQGPARGEPAR